jgi:5-formyltetrahydrofolate cyclo-ligase
MTKDDEITEVSSPPCYLHEFAADLAPTKEAPEALGWPAIRAWRRETREKLIAQRLAASHADRRARAERAKEHLRTSVTIAPSAVLGIYWPFRGEIDLRDVAARHIESGGVAALPVVVAKSAPVEFWQWEPGARMQRGVWNIPVPVERRVVRPDVLLIPLVGFDRQIFRLGYGGGYYDRTLAALDPLPLRIGVGYADAELETIHPQPHDVPMSMIVTDAGPKDPSARKP